MIYLCPGERLLHVIFVPQATITMKYIINTNAFKNWEQNLRAGNIMYHNCYSYAYLSLTHTRIKHTWAIEHSSVECYCAVATVQMQSAHAHRREPKMQICQTHRWFPVYLFCFFFTTSSLSLSLTPLLSLFPLRNMWESKMNTKCSSEKPLRQKQKKT